jgi:hypothetical protein
MPVQEQYEISPLKLWSPLQRQLAACGQVKGCTQQWIGTIRNLQKKGVSAVELEWSGVLPLLGEDFEANKVFDELIALAAALCGKPPRAPVEQPPSVVHVAALLAFLANKPACELVLQRHITNEYVPQIRYEKLPRPGKIPPPVVLNGRREVRILHYRERTFGLCIWLHVEVDAGLFGRHRYWSLSVPRGRKKLASHSVGRRFVSGHEALAYGRALIHRMAQRLSQEGFVGPTKGLNHFTRFSLPGGDNYTEWLMTAPNLSMQYWGEHFDLPNIVAHVRTTERSSLQGPRLLLMEEIQSDWNQALREVELNGEILDDTDDEEDLPPDNPFRYHWVDAALRMMLLLAANRGFKAIAWLPGRIHAERFPWANAAGLSGFYDELLPKTVSKLGQSWGATITEVSIPTQTRNFVIREAKGRNGYLVVEKANNREIEHCFSSIHEADEYRLMLETPITEQVPALLISDAMREDLIANGLPCLGAIGRRTPPSCQQPQQSR